MFPTRSLLLLSVGILFLLSWNAKEARAQDASAESQSAAHSQDAVYPLSGTVVNAATGEPIGRALVQLNGKQFEGDPQRMPQRTGGLAVVLEGPDSQRSTLTDSGGHFQFEGLPRMHASLSARKPGFFTEAQLGEGRVAGQPVEVGPNSATALVKLIPEAVMTGRVTNANGQPLEGLAIHIGHLQRVNGRELLQEAHENVTTNEDGEFRVAGLQPGAYYVSAHPNWDQSQAQDQVKTAYPITYYPGATERVHATPVQLSGGQHAQIDFALNEVPVALLEGAVAGYPAGHEAELRFLNLSGDDISFDKQYDPQTRRFQARVVAADRCIIKADAEDTLGHGLHAELNLPAGQNGLDLRLIVAPALYIPIAVRMQATKMVPSIQPGQPGHLELAGQAGGLDATSSFPVSVSLHPMDVGQSEVVAALEGDPPSLVLRDIEAGRYKVEVVPQNSGWYVKSVQYGGSDLAHDELTAEPNGSSVMEIVLGDDPAGLGITVSSTNSKQQAYVLVVPDHGPLGPKMFVTASSGVSQVSELAPGEYKVFAFDRLDGLEYGTPEALRDYLPQATQVSIQPGEIKSIKVDLIRRGG